MISTPNLILKTHLLVDSLILSWVPLGSLVGGGWDLAGGLAKGLGGWGGHLDGISLKEFAGRVVVKCRWASIALWREEFRKCCVRPAKGLSESGLMWLRVVAGASPWESRCHVISKGSPGFLAFVAGP